MSSSTRGQHGNGHGCGCLRCSSPAKLPLKYSLGVFVLFVVLMSGENAPFETAPTTVEFNNYRLSVQWEEVEPESTNEGE
ncbi:hypothetical protein IID22_02255 [Patescibacteria group bacterium]|nr:hypothetical protein [Patescibacteria group bacterium]